MKAAWIESYGGPEALRFGERPAPQPGPDEVLIDVKAASVNPIDWKLREGKLRANIPLPLPSILGRDFSGVVSAVGPQVHDLAPGAEVFGVTDAFRGGSHAEFAVAHRALLARKPHRVNHVQAAALPHAGATAMVSLEEVARLSNGERILIHGGAGGVGGFAVQLAKFIGAWVAVTCSDSNRDYVLSLGADCAIDYAHEDFTAILKDIDVVFDTIGGEIHHCSMKVLKSNGRLVYVIAAPIPPAQPRKDVRVLRANMFARADQGDRRALFERMAWLVDNGAIRPQVGAVLPLKDAAKAYEMSRAGQVRGKIVLATSD